MKKLVSIVFIAFLVWNYIGYFAFFEFEKKQIRREIKLKLKESVPKEELILFEFTKQEIEQLTWLKKNEFLYKGNLFDVVRTEKLPDGRLRLNCISDKKETVLFANLDFYVNRSYQDNNEAPLRGISYLIQQPQLLPENFDEPIRCNNLEDEKEFFPYRFAQSTSILATDHLPPERFI